MKRKNNINALKPFENLRVEYLYKGQYRTFIVKAVITKEGETVNGLTSKPGKFFLENVITNHGFWTSQIKNLKMCKEYL